MPELPEVETIVGGLRPAILGREVTGLRVLWSGTLGGVDPVDFGARLRGQRITALERRGKYILLYLGDGDVVVIHLRMTGRLFLSAPDAPPDRFLRVVIELSGGNELRFADLRKFGRIAVAREEDLPSALPKLGPEPLTEAYSVREMAQTLGRRRAPIKSVLLNQQLLAGLGNIYADEALYLARIHPLRRADTLDEREWERVYAGVQEALRSGIANRGTSFRDYRDGQNQRGRNQELLAVYRRTGQPCPECGTPVERVVVGGRSSHFCPRCQCLP